MSGQHYNYWMTHPMTRMQYFTMDFRELPLPFGILHSAATGT